MIKYLVPILLFPTLLSATPLSDWQSHMTQYGGSVCNYIKDTSQTFDDRLISTYYDGERVFYQMCDYLSNPLWCTCAQESEKVYRDGYVIPNNGALPGYWIMADGLAEDYTRNADAQSKSAYQMLMANGSFVNSSGWNDANQPDWSYMRETAYALRLHIMAPRFGLTRNPARITQLTQFLIGQLYQMYGSKTAPYRKPFMTGLAAEALIDYYEKINADGVVVVALMDSADYMWANLWVASAGAFRYTDDPIPEAQGGQGTSPSPDLNLLIAPMYEWLFKKTGQQKYRDEGDLIFAGGVANAYLGGGKQFDQNYRWSFKYVEWRYGPASNTPTPFATITVPPSNTPTPTRTPNPTNTATATPVITPTRTPCGSAFVKKDVYCHIDRLEGK